MAEFLPAFERMIVNEGGYVLHQIEGDRGGMTYAGIARSRWPSWPGWATIDAGRAPEAQLVRDFYRSNFWDAMRLDEVATQSVAATLFDFSVNAGTTTAARLVQLVVGVTPDGGVGPKTLGALNAFDPDVLLPRFALAKLARYAQIVTRDKSQARFLLGWVRRTLKEASA